MEQKELPESAYDLLLRLWAESNGEHIISVRKTQKERKHDKELR